MGENVSVTPETITFILDEDRQKKTLTIRNDGPKPLMIKMKSTLPGALKMRPVYGRVDAKATATIQLELRWNSAAKRIPADSTKDRVTVVLAEVPNLPKPPPIFWMEFKKHDKTTKTITKKVQLKFEPSSSEKQQKPPGDASTSEKPNEASEEKADMKHAKAGKPKASTLEPTSPHITNVEPEASTPRAVLIAEKEKNGQDKSTDKTGNQAQAKSEPGTEKTKEASSDEPRDKRQATTTGEKPQGASVEKASVTTAKETSDSSSSSSSSSSEEEKK